MALGICLPGVFASDLMGGIHPKSKSACGQPHQFSHQKRTARSEMNASRWLQKPKKINGRCQYSAAHNGLVAGSSLT
jgi:hypothetical protein